MINNIILSKD